MYFTTSTLANIQASSKMIITLLTSLSLLNIEPHQLTFGDIEDKLQMDMPQYRGYLSEQPQYTYQEFSSFDAATARMLQHNLFNFMLQAINAADLTKAYSLELMSIELTEQNQYNIKFELKIPGKKLFKGSIKLTHPSYSISFNKDSDMRLLPEVAASAQQGRPMLVRQHKRILYKGLPPAAAATINSAAPAPQNPALSSPRHRRITYIGVPAAAAAAGQKTDDNFTWT